MIYFIGKNDVNFEGVANATLQDCVNYLKNLSVIGIDIETTRKFPKNTFDNEDVYEPGLDPYLSKVIMLQLGDLDRRYVIDTRYVDITDLLPILNNPNTTFVGHNLKFEAKHLGYNYGVVFHKIWDTMLVEQNLTNGFRISYGLASLAERYLGAKKAENIDLFNEAEEGDIIINKAIRTEFLYIEDKPFTQEQIVYGSDDIVFPLMIKALQERNTDFQVVNDLENSFCLCLADMELRGMPLIPTKWLEVYDKSKITYSKRLRKINDYIEQHHSNYIVSNDLFATKPICNIMWSSSDQVIELFKYFGNCPMEKSKETKKLEYSVGASALLKLVSSELKEAYSRGDDIEITDFETFIIGYLQFKKSEQSITTFGKSWLKYVHPITKRVHSNYKQILNTGRISSNKPNLQNIPSDKSFRDCFESNISIINCDYSSQESRVLADVSQDEDMISFFNDGHPIFKDDFHSFVATKMFRIIRGDETLIVTKKTHPKERQDAKSIGFKIAYGGSAFTLKDDFGVEEDIAQEFIDGYFAAFPSLDADFKEAKKKAVALGYIEIDPVTRRKWFDKDFQEMNAMYQKLNKLYPKEYKTWDQEKRDKFKAELKVKYPNMGKEWSEYFSWVGKLERNALNYRIQGLSGSMTKYAAVLFRKHQITTGNANNYYLINLVHDEILAEANTGYEQEASEIVKTCMEEAGAIMCQRVKMGAVPVISKVWEH